MYHVKFPNGSHQSVRGELPIPNCLMALLSVKLLLCTLVALTLLTHTKILNKKREKAKKVYNKNRMICECGLSLPVALWPSNQTLTSTDSV